MKVKPRNDWVLVRPKVGAQDEEKSKGGIIIPKTAKEPTIRAIVLALGPGKLLESGEVAPIRDLRPEDEVLINEYNLAQSNGFVNADEGTFFVPEGDILAVIEA